MARLVRTKVGDASTEYTSIAIQCYKGKDISEIDVPGSYVQIPVPDGAQPGDANFPDCPDCDTKRTLLFGGRGAVKCTSCGSEFSSDD